MAHFFTNETPDINTNTNGKSDGVANSSGDYGIIHSEINQTLIDDGLTERGVGLGKLGSSMPTPMARLFLFSAALREVNALEGRKPGEGHIGKANAENELQPTPYHDLVGEMLDMLEFVFKYGDERDFHVQRWDLGVECQALDRSGVIAHKQLASALRSAFDYGDLRGHTIHLFRWNKAVIGGTSPISLVYTSANLRSALRKENVRFAGDAGNILFSDNYTPLHKRDEAFREYLYRLIRTDLKNVNPSASLIELRKFIQDSATNYDPNLDAIVKDNPSAYTGVKDLKSQGANVKVAGVQLRVRDTYVAPSTSDYILKPTANYYQHGNDNTEVPMILTKNGVDGLIYINGRAWDTNSDKIDNVLPENIQDRRLPGIGQKYPFLTVSDFFEDKVIEVSYKINSDKFFTGCGKPISFLLPLKKIFFDYFKVSDLYNENGNYTNMLVVKYDGDRSELTVELNLPLVRGHSICLHKTYDTSEGSEEKLNCFDGSRTFDFAVFPFYRLEPDTSHNVYNVMLGKTIDGVTMKFYEPTITQNGATNVVSAVSKQRTIKKKDVSLLATDHIRVRGPFSYAELTISDGTDVNALILPIFKKVNSDSTLATQEFLFGIDFGTTNTHVAYVMALSGMKSFGNNQIKSFGYTEADTQMVMFNDKDGVAEFGAFATAVKRELVPSTLGETIKYPMRTATCQVDGNPNTLEMFFNTNIGFNYGNDISRSGNYRTQLKWDRFNGSATKERQRSYFAQMLWMMKNKSVLNDGTDSFKLVVTYPISMRANDVKNFENAWKDAIDEVQCSVDIRYRTESVAPYYSYLTGLQYGQPYANMDIGGGTTDILYVNPITGEANVFSAFFAADDLWNDGVVNQSKKMNGFLNYYREVRGKMLGDKQADFKAVFDAAEKSADIISYLFTNDSWSKLSDTLQGSRIMMQLPIVHFSALVFYMAYALHMAELDVPRDVSFTGMGSKYIKLISSDESGISKLINAIFHYAGRPEVLNNSKLLNASVKVSFAPNPKEVTATGALISLSYDKQINPSEDIYFGYEEENPEKTMRYNDITADVQDSVVRLFKKFTSMFQNEEVRDALSDFGYHIDEDVTSKLDQYAVQSLLKAKVSSSKGQTGTDKLKEPMFFWPLKDSLYIIGKELSDSAIKNNNN